MPRLTEVLANKNVKFYNRRFVPVYKQAGPQLLKEQITNRKDRDAGTDHKERPHPTPPPNKTQYFSIIYIYI